METLLRAVRYGVRQLRMSPTFTVVAVLTLALGVGANTAIFSVIQAVLLHPAGVSEPERVASFHARYTQLNLPSIGVSPPDFKDVQSLGDLVEAAAVGRPASFNSVTSRGSEHLQAAAVSHDWFRVFGAQPILGRVFAPEEDQKGANFVAVLSYAAWQRIFGGQPDVIGRPLVMDGQSYRVIGVMRSDFDWPRGRDVWTPVGLAPESFAADQRFNESYDSVVRLKPGVSVAQLNAGLAQKRMEEVRREGDSAFAESEGWSMFAQPWTQDAAGDLRKPLVALFAVVMAVLLIACANVAGLLLARTAGRTRELSIRSALGATAFQITLQFVVDTSLLAVASAALAVVCGPMMGRLLLMSIPNHLADGFVVQTDPRLVAATIGFSLLAAFLAGVAPAVQVARMQRVSEFGKSVTSGVSRQRLRTVLVGTEIALAFVLLAGTGMFLASLRQLQSVDPGFRSEGVLTGSVMLSGSGYRADEAKRLSFMRDVLSRVRQQPGVVTAAATSFVPFSGEVGSWGSFFIQDKPTPEGKAGPHSEVRAATAEYLAAMQVPLMHGRWFGDGDRAGTVLVAVVDDVLARAYWPGQNPVGAHVRYGPAAPWLEIVGVVGHTRRDSLEVDENKGVIYRPLEQSPGAAMSFVVRTKGDPRAMQETLARSVQQVDATEALYGVRTLSALVNDSLGARQLLVWLLSLFGGLALLLAAIGIYGLLSYTTSQRSAEIGIRMALGAQRWQIAQLVVKEMLVMVGAGLAIGLVAAMVLQRVLMHLFAGMGGGVVLSLLAAVVGLAAAAALAVAIPARRSASVDPAVVLRSE